MTRITINSAVLYAVAFLITTIVHEFAHGTVGALFGSDPVVHHNFVEHLAADHLVAWQQIAIALAGPVVSLLQGLLAGYLYLRSRRQTLTDLFMLWFSVLGFNNFLGYLMTGPLFAAGDIGKAYQISGLPVWVQIGMALVGAGLLLLIAYKLTEPFLRFSHKSDWIKDGRSRKKFSFHILILPWIIGSALITLLYLPVVAIVSIIYPVMSGMVFIFPWQNAVNATDVPLADDQGIDIVSMPAVLVLIALAGLFRLVLAPGISPG